MTDDKPEPRRRTWVGTWLRDEAFWRDVASRSLAGVIVLAVGAIVAAVLGFIDLLVLIRLLLFLAVVILFPWLFIIKPATALYPAISAFREWGHAKGVGRLIAWNVIAILASIVWTVVACGIALLAIYFLTIPWG